MISAAVPALARCGNCYAVNLETFPRTRPLLALLFALAHRLLSIALDISLVVAIKDFETCI